MDDRSGRQSLLFINSVIGSLVLISGIYLAALLKAESRILTSLFDRLVLHVFFLAVISLWVIWLLLIIVRFTQFRIGNLVYVLKWFLFFIYYPLGRAVSALFGIKRESYQTAFLNFQNGLIHTYGRLFRRILLLLPHCLQYHECRIRITRNINDCADCGDCDICRLKDLSQTHDLQVGIANGGTLARKIVQDTLPDAIIAVACQRDLTDGVRESWRYPVYGILNDRPFGPCFDTKVDVQHVSDIIKHLTGSTTEDTEKHRSK